MTRLTVVDTDVVSRYWKRNLPLAVQVLLGGDLFISAATLGELHKWTVWRHWSDRQTANLLHFVSERFEMLPADTDVAMTWGQLMADSELKGQKLPVNDCWIAATCIAWELPLLTLNRKDFERVPGLQLLSPTRADAGDVE